MQRNKKNTLKVVVVGDSGVGKTCLMQRYMTGSFSSDYKTTVGADFLSTKITVEDTTYNLQIWDTAGQEKFQAIGSAFYRGSDCCIVVFDVCLRKSFESLTNWMSEFVLQGEVQEVESFPFVIIGNKIDINQRQVSTEEATEFCASKGIPYFEASAKQDIGIQEAFEKITKLSIERSIQNNAPAPAANIVTLSKSKQTSPKEEYCKC